MHLRLDLHGMTKQEAQYYIEYQLQLLKEQIVTHLFIITGRGKHINKNGSRAVLYKWLPGWLKTQFSLKDKIVKIHSGIGAYEIILDNYPEEKIKEEIKNWINLNLPPSMLNGLKIAVQNKDKNFSNKYPAVVGVLYSYGIWVKQDTRLGLNFLQKAADNKNPEALLQLANIYEQGLHTIKPNPKKSAQYLKTLYNLLKKQKSTNSALLGSCAHQLAIHYYIGQGVYQNDEQTFRLMEEAAQLNNSAAQYSLGYCYYSGNGVEINYQKALDYFMQAAKNDHPEAYRKLALLYHHGYGTSPDLDLAFDWYKKAADNNDIFSIYQIGLYFGGFLASQRIQRDDKTAFDYFTKAADYGDLDAKFQVALAYLYGKGVLFNPSKAIEIFKLLADKESSHACFFLALEYYQGQNIKHSLIQALFYFEKAAELGYKAAIPYVIACSNKGEKGLLPAQSKKMKYWQSQISQSEKAFLKDPMLIYTLGSQMLQVKVAKLEQAIKTATIQAEKSEIINSILGLLKLAQETYKYGEYHPQVIWLKVMLLDQYINQRQYALALNITIRKFQEHSRTEPLSEDKKYQALFQHTKKLQEFIIIIQLAQTCFEKRLYGKVLNLCIKARKLEPFNEHVLQLLGHTYSQLQDYDQAFYCFAQQKNSPELQLLLEETRNLLKKQRQDEISYLSRLEQCISFFEEEAKAYPENFNAQFLYAGHLASLCHYEKALEFYDKALKLTDSPEPVCAFKVAVLKRQAIKRNGPRPRPSFFNPSDQDSPKKNESEFIRKDNIKASEVENFKKDYFEEANGCNIL